MPDTGGLMQSLDNLEELLTTEPSLVVKAFGLLLGIEVSSDEDEKPEKDTKDPVDLLLGRGIEIPDI